MARKFDDDDDEKRRGGFWRFLKGVLFALVLSAVGVWALSVYVLPPPVIPEPEPEQTGPVLVDGIEVSKAPAYTGTPGQADAEQPQQATSEPLDLGGPAMVVNSVPFSGDLEAPLVAVVLDDTAAQPLLHPLIFATELPLTIGVVAGGGGEAETAKAARDAGFEVVAQVRIAPPGESDGSNLEYGLEEADAALRTLTLLQQVPSAVALGRTLASVAAPDDRMLSGIASVIGPLGFAYLDINVPPGVRSPAMASGLAVREGAMVEVSRHSIPPGASAAEAHAILDAASADASETGWAVVVASPSEALLQALLLWGGEGEGSLAKMAPLTAVLRKKIGQ